MELCRGRGIFARWMHMRWCVVLSTASLATGNLSVSMGAICAPHGDSMQLVHDGVYAGKLISLMVKVVWPS